MRKEFEVTGAQPYPLGASFLQEGMHIAAVCGQTDQSGASDEIGVILYDRKHKDGMKIPFPKESRVGAVCSMLLMGYHDKECSYLFYCGERTWQDPYCKKIENSHKYGTRRKSLPRCMVQSEPYNWEGDRTLDYRYEDMILYALHVRGFTKHKSSGVEHRGTYRGLTEKIPYLNDLGVTSVLLMPSYEFDEIMAYENSMEAMSMEQAASSYKQIPSRKDTGENGGGNKDVYKVNFWGYQRGLYYIPKYGYAYGKDAVTEYKDMVKALHRSGIEVLMQFYFPPEITAAEITDILKYWVLEYHIDGFHLLGVDIPIAMLSKEPLLSATKIMAIQQYSPEPGDYMAKSRSLGRLSDGFLYDIRRLIKGDDNMINQLVYHVRNNCPEAGIVNYIAKWEGMRLVDMVSYDRKHNEANSEDNQDGTDYNCSWNCGVEGKSRRKNITDLRLRQMKNALSLVFLSQGTPLLYSGDEFANTQDGNNNPYCQDNAVAWVKWNQTESGKELLEYTKMLIQLRKNHPILHSSIPLKGMDYLSCGYPDISFHGKEAWRADMSPVSRSIGIMYCGSYGEIDGHKDETFFYIGINLHWRAYYLGLPQLPKGKEWTLYASTDPNEAKDENLQETGEESAEPKQEIYVGPRTVVIYTVKDSEQIPDKRRKKS